VSDGQRIHAVYGVVNPDKLVPRSDVGIM